MILKIKLLLVLSIASVLLAGAQASLGRTLTIENGLSSNNIRTLFMDARGLIWFGTDTGLDRFDGLQVVNYAKRFELPLKGAVQSVVESKPDVLMLGTSWGAFRYDVATNKMSTIRFDSPSVDVRQILVTTKGLTYFATDRGMYVLQKATLKAKTYQSSEINGRSIFCLLEDALGTIWLGADNGLYRCNSSGTCELETSITDIRTLKIVGRMLYIGTQNGLLQYNLQTKRVSIVHGTEGISILSMSIDSFDILYVGTDNSGVYRLDTKFWNVDRFNPSEFYATKTICSILCDANGLMWMGTFDTGVQFRCLRPNKQFQTVEFKYSANSNVRSLHISPQGEKYVGTRNGMLLCMDSENKLKSITTGFRSKILTAIYPYPGKPDLLLVGTFGGGATVYDKKSRRCTDFSPEKTFQTGTVYKFRTDGQNHLWMATLDGLYSYDWTKKLWSHFNSTSVTGSNEVFTLDTDDQDRVWIGTKTGACFYSKTEKKFVQPVACRLRRFQCTSIKVDSRKNIWLCFNKGGVLELDSNLNEKRWLDQEIGLPENAPSSLMEDASGSLWIGSSKGLFQVCLNSDVRLYDKEDGLNGIGFCPESAVLDPSGKLWWINEFGLVSFLGPQKALKKPASPLIFTDLFINGNRFDADTLNFVRKQGVGRYAVHIKGRTNNNLEFRVVALNYAQAGKIQYAFKLVGHDAHWQAASRDPKVSYARLKAGRYVLYVKALEHNGNWTTSPLQMEVTIQPFFYETVWFLVLVSVILLVSMMYYLRHYVRQLRVRWVGQKQVRRGRTGSASNPGKMNEQKCVDIMERLLTHMQEDKPWLNPALRLADVAASLGCFVHELSQVLNVQLNQNFSDFVNSYRVEAVKERIRQGDTKRFTLTAIALQCGFSAKSSFQRAFKKATDATPSDFVKDQGRNVTSSTNKPS